MQGELSIIQQWVLGQEQSAWKTPFIVTERGHSLRGHSEVPLVTSVQTGMLSAPWGL